MSKLDAYLKLMESPTEDFIQEIIHEDFFLVREEGLETHDEFIDYVLGHVKEGHHHQVDMIEVKCLFENKNSLVVQDLFDSVFENKRFSTITYITIKDGLFWRAMMNKFQVDKDTISLS